MTVQEAGERLGVGKTAVIQMISRGALKAKLMKVGKLKWYEITEREIARFIRDHEFRRGPRGVKWIRRKTA